MKFQMVVRHTIRIVLLSLIISNSVFAQTAESLGGNINSMYDESHPVLSDDGSTLFFTRSYHPENMGGKKDPGDIWFSTLDENGKWSKAINLGLPLNNHYYNAVLSITKDAETIYLQSIYKPNGKKPDSQGVSYASKSSFGWNFPAPLKIKYFTNKSDHQSLSISPDGKVMILSLESFGTYGAEDLYVCFKQEDGTWSDPKNLGTKINTQYQEMTPFISPDNKTLFFASNGLPGSTSRDIFKSVRQDDTWTNWSDPVRLSNVNSTGVELSYFIPKKSNYAYFVTTQNSDGYGDIKKIKLSPDELPKSIAIAEDPAMADDQKVSMICRVLNQKTNQQIAAQVFYRDNGTANYKKVNANAAGQFIFAANKGSNAEIRVKANGYLTLNEKFAFNENMEQDFSLTPLEVGTTIQMNNVLFKQGTEVILEESYEEIDRFVNLMEEYPQIEIELSGHTDNQGNSKLNLELSQKRAEKVMDYMVEQGVDASRIVGKGYGSSRPIASNQGEQTRRLNRRVEITILKK